MEMTQYINNKAKYQLSIIQYPSGRFGFVGSVPADLCEEKPYHLGGTCMKSKVYETKEAAEKDMAAYQKI
jgi:hypothetical protein